MHSNYDVKVEMTVAASIDSQEFKQHKFWNDGEFINLYVVRLHGDNNCDMKNVDHVSVLVIQIISPSCETHHRK